MILLRQNPIMWSSSATRSHDDLLWWNSAMILFMIKFCDDLSRWSSSAIEFCDDLVWRNSVIILFCNRIPWCNRLLLQDPMIICNEIPRWSFLIKFCDDFSRRFSSATEFYDDFVWRNPVIIFCEEDYQNSVMWSPLLQDPMMILCDEIPWWSFTIVLFCDRIPWCDPLLHQSPTMICDKIPWWSFLW